MALECRLQSVDIYVARDEEDSSRINTLYASLELAYPSFVESSRLSFTRYREREREREKERNCKLPAESRESRLDSTLNYTTL